MDRLAHRIHTNYVPTTSELALIHTYTTSLSSQSSSISSEIAALEARLALLKASRQRLADTAAPYLALAHPMRRLPNELLQQIFVMCLPETRNAVMHASEAPLLLARVCRLWRRVVLGTPVMWSCLHIVPPHYNPDATAALVPGSSAGHREEEDPNVRRFRRKQEVVQRWLGRSGDCPLNLSFVWFGGDSDEETRLCAAFLCDIILPLARRWRRIELQMPLRMLDFSPLPSLSTTTTTATTGEDRGFRSLRGQDVPLLEVLHLTDNRSSFGGFELALNVANTPQPHQLQPWPAHLGFAAEAARLRDLNLTFFAGGIQIPDTVPWHQLTRLYLESNVEFFFEGTKQMLGVLERCVRLETCTLKLPLSFGPAAQPQPQPMAVIPPPPGVAPPPPPPVAPIAAGVVVGAGVAGGQAPETGYKPLDCVVTLPELTHLYIDGDQNLFNAFHMTTTLSNIRAPKLRELELVGRNGRSSPYDDLIAPDVPPPPQHEAGGSSGLSSDSEEEDEEEEEEPTALTLDSPNPIAGLYKLLVQSQCPPLEKLRIESIALDDIEDATRHGRRSARAGARAFLKCMELVPDLKELVVRDYGVKPIGWHPPPPAIGSSSHRRCRRHSRSGALGLSEVGNDDEEAYDSGEDSDDDCVEDQILKALLVDRGWGPYGYPHPQLHQPQSHTQHRSSSSSRASALASPATSSWTIPEDAVMLMPISPASSHTLEIEDELLEDDDDLLHDHDGQANDGVVIHVVGDAEDTEGQLADDEHGAAGSSDLALPVLLRDKGKRKQVVWSDETSSSSSSPSPSSEAELPDSPISHLLSPPRNPSPVDHHHHHRRCGCRPGRPRVFRPARYRGPNFLPLLPNLAKLEFALAGADQELFLAVVESRFLPDPPAQVEVGPPTAEGSGLRAAVSDPEEEEEDEDEESEEEEEDSDDEEEEGPAYNFAVPRPDGSNGTTVSTPFVPLSTVTTSPTPTTTTTQESNRTMARLESLKCSFTTPESYGVQQRLANLRALGLDVDIVFGMGMGVGGYGVGPSPWAGVEGM